MTKIGKVHDHQQPLPRCMKKVGVLWSTNVKVIDSNVFRPQWTFSGDYVLALRGCCRLKFLDTLEIDPQAT